MVGAAVLKLISEARLWSRPQLGHLLFTTPPSRFTPQAYQAALQSALLQPSSARHCAGGTRRVSAWCQQFRVLQV